ncbi:hypothetical protein HPB50_010308 [Hyalomma asiaticum]|uniref:Uncharacterized protein n=1 Tax=Hyalomma asiaticum TaxID=266040 RepID=A0ACB7SP33_HYAAI|nr:hypothetical protein HPB50_010308 [Hyalomma asiaticum]
MDQYFPGIASGSTEPNTLDSTTSGHTNSDGPHSCHTYLFAPLESNGADEELQSFAGNNCTAQCPEQCHVAVPQPQEQFASGHLVTPSPSQHPPFNGCCEPPSPSHQQNVGSGCPQGLTEPGFVSSIKPAQTGLTEIFTTLGKHYAPRVSEVVGSFKFFSRHRKEGETVHSGSGNFDRSQSSRVHNVDDLPVSAEEHEAFDLWTLQTVVRSPVRW